MMPEPLQGDSKIYQDIAKNYQDLKRIYTVYLDFLEYVKNNPEDVVISIKLNSK
jgi:MscS family membrane protein